MAKCRVQKIGIYGGTFDPVHHAHLILAREAAEQLDLAEVIFVPAAISPHKLHAQPTPAGIRLEMLQAAIAGEPRFGIDDQELRRPAPSFTIDTIEAMRRAEPAREFFYFLGSDNLPRLHTWHRFEDLRQLVSFVVLDRGLGATAGAWHVIRRQIDVSSTEIRNRVATRRSIRYLVPTAVAEIIRREHLYQDLTALQQKS
ncbi:MAG: nicotinate-nucleotide adenylyltransferase [Verrucomicrobiota bacterium]|nr:nicotinate-nucleotide adenylyltransferase [Verrucomicrobiota bacterium]